MDGSSDSTARRSASRSIPSFSCSMSSLVDHTYGHRRGAHNRYYILAWRPQDSFDVRACVRGLGQAVTHGRVFTKTLINDCFA